MTIEECESLKAEATRHFNDLKVEEASKKQELENIDTRLKQLQGQYEALDLVAANLKKEQEANTEALEDLARLTPDPFKPKKNKEAGNGAN